MALIESENLTDLAHYAADNVCVIKSTLGSTLCDELVSAIDRWGKQWPQNQDRGRNWWYRVNKEGSDFDSFLFWKLNELEPEVFRRNLRLAYSRLFEAHILCGTIPPKSTLDELLAAENDQPALDPLVFFYRSGTGKFQRHAHELGYQKTQVLINLTKRGRDYAGGETLIEEANGNVIELGEVFDQGDLFSFPYSLFHSVKPVSSPDKQGGIGRMSILMPFHPRGATRIRY